MRRKKIRIKDIARRLGYSPATISQALNQPHTVNRSTRKEILLLCEELGYQKPVKSKRRTFNIAVVSGDTHNFANDFYAKVCEELLIYAKEKRYNLLFEPWKEVQDDFPWSIAKNKVDGVISLGAIGHDKVILIKQKNLPIVACGHPLPDVEIHTVLPDGRAGSYQATKHLIDLGHRRIAKITGGKRFDQVAQDRVEGFRYALTKAGIKIKEEYIINADFINYTNVEEPLEKLFSLPHPPTAIVCASDPIAYSVYDHLTQKGYAIPQDISITGFDDFEPPVYARPFLPKLTTVHVNVRELARNTMDILFELMRGPKKIAWRYTLPVGLELGETSAGPKDRQTLILQK